MTRLTESDVEQAALTWLTAMDWQVSRGPGDGAALGLGTTAELQRATLHSRQAREFTAPARRVPARAVGAEDTRCTKM